MKPALIYIHIPKAAGTSHRQYLIQVFGEDNVFWYGLSSDSSEFDVGELGSSPAIGGHRPLNFYPESYDALYTSIVREPVARVVSFFNYCSTVPSHGAEDWINMRKKDVARWSDRGLDPSSLYRSIKECDEFRNEISNLQCKYLSRHGATFDGVCKTFETEDIVIGVLDQLSLFNNFFKSEFNFPIESALKANAGTTGYSDEILAEPGLVELIRSCTLEDQRLYDFVRFECSGLYRGAVVPPKLKQHVPRLQSTRSPTAPFAPINWQQVTIFSKGLLALNAGKVIRVALIISNRTKVNIAFSKEKDSDYAIGWEFRDESGCFITGAKGISRVEQIVPLGMSKIVHIDIDINEIQLQGRNPHYVEFSIVENNQWVREDNPLSSGWALLYTGKPDTITA